MVVTASRIAESNFEANANVNVVTRKDIEEKALSDCKVKLCVQFLVLLFKTTVLQVPIILPIICM